MKVLLSYSWVQRSPADTIDTELRSVGLRVIRDVRSLKPFDDLAQFMVDAVAAADVVVPMLSTDYLRSQNCMAELAMAVEKNLRAVYPIRLARYAELTSESTTRALQDFWTQKAAKDAATQVWSSEFPSSTRIADALPRILHLLKTTLVPSLKELRDTGYVALLDSLGFARSRLVSELLHLESADDPEEREIGLDEFLREHPDHALAHHIRAGTQKARSDFRRARKSYETSIQFDPSFPDAHNDYALLMENQFQEMEVAENHYRRAIELDESFDLALNNYGSFLKASGRYHEAEQYLRCAIAKSPSYAGARMNLAILLAEHFDDIEQARRELETALRIDDSYADAHENYAVLMAKYFGSHDIAQRHSARARSLRTAPGYHDRGWNPDLNKADMLDS